MGKKILKQEIPGQFSKHLGTFGLTKQDYRAYRLKRAVWKTSGDSKIHLI
jgi:hypothetical protein